ncbi:MAG: acyl-CoA thioesterase [Granulosicoccus sp.]|nr:acyl-CoA thioesterase [Granulosicoccus sp.]
MSDSEQRTRARDIDRDKTPASLRTIAMPADTNPNGDIFGGWILSQMDLAGGTHAFYVAQGRVATVAVTGMKFYKPVNVGDEVSCYCATHVIGNTSVTVHVETWVRRRRLAVEEQVTEGLFTFVAIDSHGKPRPIGEPEGDFDAPGYDQGTCGPQDARGQSKR